MDASLNVSLRSWRTGRPHWLCGQDTPTGETTIAETGLHPFLCGLPLWQLQKKTSTCLSSSPYHVSFISTSTSSVFLPLLSLLEWCHSQPWWARWNTHQCFSDKAAPTWRILLLLLYVLFDEERWFVLTVPSTFFCKMQCYRFFPSSFFTKPGRELDEGKKVSRVVQTRGKRWNLTGEGSDENLSVNLQEVGWGIARV